jgi:hypothetical protein
VSLNLLLANDSALRAYAGANRVEPGRPTPAQASPAAGRALAYLQQLYPGRITAASLLDRFGTEHARAVRGIVTPADRLSYSSTRGSFFEPTLALSPGHVHHAVPYRSPSTDQWVLPSSTPVFDEAGRAWGMVHLEMPLDGFRTAALETATGRGGSSSVVEDRTGRVLLESGQRVFHASATARPGRDLAPGLRDALDGRRDRPVSVDGRRAVSARVDGGSDNANAWSVVVSAPLPAAAGPVASVPPRSPLRWPPCCCWPSPA